jgi:hypothetical protein
MKLATLLVCAFVGMMPAALAQKWEFGGGVGGGFYTSKDVTAPGGSASAKIKSNLSGSAWLGNNSRSLLGGELRYDYQAGDLQLKQGSTEAVFGAQTHAFHYDMLFHFSDRDSAFRPFVAVGGGVKIYKGTGKEVAFQPLSNFAFLTKDQDLVGLVSVGAGVKIKIAPHLQLRLDVHDYLTPFPKQVITPAANAKVSGWLQDIVPMAGISALF